MLMPTLMKTRFSAQELQQATIHPGFSFTKGCPFLKVPVNSINADKIQDTWLFDLTLDPDQHDTIDDLACTSRMLKAMKQILAENDALFELYDRNDL